MRKTGDSANRHIRKRRNVGRSGEVKICKFPECTNTFFRRGRQEYCCHQCNITHLNRQRTPEYNAKHWASYYLRHAEEQKAKAKAQRERLGRDKINEIFRAWYKRDPAVRIALNTARKVAKLGNPYNVVTAIEWESLKAAWEYRCAYCKYPTRALTQDHVIPLSKGGTHTLDNIVPACSQCNGSKWNRDVGDFLVSDFLAKRHAYVASL